MLSLRRVQIDVITSNQIYSLNCSEDTTLLTICNYFNVESNYAYCLFENTYYVVKLRLRDTNIKSGEVLLL